MDTDRTEIAIELSPEAADLLAVNEIDLVSALRSQSLDIERGRLSSGGPATGQKAVELVILASAAAAPLVAGAIARIIDALGRNRRAAVHEKDGPAHAAATSRHKTSVSFLGLKVELTDSYGRP